MKTVFLLYVTDKWFTHNSKQLQGVFSDRYKLFEYVDKVDEMTHDKYIELSENNQTTINQEGWLILEEAINPNYNKLRR